MRSPKDMDYVYVSTMVRTYDGASAEAERNDALASCRTLSDLFEAVKASGIAKDYEKKESEDDYTAVDSILSAALDGAVDLIKRTAPDPAIYNFLLYKFDCNNIKLCIKALLSGDEVEKDKMFSCSLIGRDDVIEAVKSKNYALLPSSMAKAAAEASSEFEKTKEARAVDFILDRACFEDMLRDAEKTKVKFFREYVEALIDTVNIKTAARISSLKVPNETAFSLLERSFIPGGTVKMGSLCGENGIYSLKEMGNELPLSKLKFAAADHFEDDDFSEEYISSVVGKYSSKTFGPEVPAIFFIRIENETKKYRKAAALISSGITDKKTFCERLGIG